jgi:tetratricopeptide (TPR) repeat protein
MSRYEKVTTLEELSPEAIQSEVERILASEKFARSKRLRSLLRFTVAQTLQGNADTLKEYVIGTEVLKKPDSYDPRSDSLVRVLASRLRVKLKEYYSDGGSDDPLVIEFPKGKYVPRFQRREQLQTEIEKKLRARNAYSRGKFLASKFNEESLAEAAEHFQEAIEADPNWALPHVCLGNTYAFQGFLGFRRPREVWPLVRMQADATLQLDEMSAEAHITVGLAYSLFDWRWRDADLHFQKAIERDSYSGTGHLWRAISVLIPTNRLSEAQEELHKAHHLAPTQFQEEATALAMYFMQRYDQALQAAGNVADQSLPSWMPWIRSCALIALERTPEAIEILERAHAADPGSIRLASTLGFAYGISGQTEKAQEILNGLRDRRAKGEWIGNFDMALVETGLGNKNEAVLLLNEALREKEPSAAFLAVDSRLASLKSVPKFAGLLRRIMLVDEVHSHGVGL